MERDTRQRQAIRNALVCAGRPLSVHELFLLAKSEISQLGIATVYRNLKDLQAEKRIIQVDLPGQPPRWELPPEEHHHHFLCRTCNKLFEVNDCPRDLQRLLPKGYTLEEHDILLRGQCDICSGL
jgi:Fur family transcriptional regulator, ferric uptake regulator